MAASGGQRGREAILAAFVLVGMAASPLPVAAADDPTVALPGTTVMAMTVDLDGDGDREIVRVLQEDNRIDHSIDAWQFDGATWTTIGSEAMPRITESEDGSAVEALNIAALLSWRVAGRERVLVIAAAALRGDLSGTTCCLAISELASSSNGGIDLRPLQSVSGGPQLVQAVDVDGDGADDLVLHEGHYGDQEGEESATVRVLRWAGSRFEPAFEMTDRELLYGFSAANTDGVIGADLLFGPGGDGIVRRLAWTDGTMRMDEGHLDLGENPEGWIVGVADGKMVLSVLEEVRVVRWPRDGAPTTDGRLTTLEYPGIWVIGDGSDALIAVQSNYSFAGGRPPTMTLHDLELRPLGEVGVNPATEAFWELANGQIPRSGTGIERNVYPYNGPIPGGLGDGLPAWVASGVLIRPGGPDGYESRPVASLLGVQPIGLAGPSDGWVAMTDGYSGSPGVAYLYAGEIPFGWGRMEVTPLDELLKPDDEAPAASLELLGAVEMDGEGGSATLLADGDGFQVAITAPPGSTVIIVNGRRVEEQVVDDQPLLVEVPQPQNRLEDVDQELEVMILIISPGGRGTVAEWTGTFVREPPEISVTATTDPMALSATISGQRQPLQRGDCQRPADRNRCGRSLHRDHRCADLAEPGAGHGARPARQPDDGADRGAGGDRLPGIPMGRDPDRRHAARRWGAVRPHPDAPNGRTACRRRRAPRGARARRAGRLRASRALIGYACHLDRQPCDRDSIRRRGTSIQ